MKSFVAALAFLAGAVVSVAQPAQLMRVQWVYTGPVENLSHFKVYTVVDGVATKAGQTDTPSQRSLALPFPDGAFGVSVSTINVQGRESKLSAPVGVLDALETPVDVKVGISISIDIE